MMAPPVMSLTARGRRQRALRRGRSALTLALAAGAAVVPLCAAGAGSVQLKPPGTADSFADELYEIITPDMYAIRLFHRTGWTGSHTVDKLRNESQALYKLASPADLAEFTGQAAAFADPKAVFVNRSLLAEDRLFEQLADTGSVSAVFVQYVNDTCDPGSGAGGTACPSAYGVAYSPLRPAGSGTPSAALNPSPDHVWVPTGTGTALANFSFPIFELPDQESSDFAYAKAAANTFTTHGDGDAAVVAPDWPFVAAEPHLYLGPAEMTSTQCLQMSALQEGKHYCDPLGGQSVWAAAPDSTGTAAAVERADAVVVVGAAMDTRGLIQTEPGLGADQTVSGLVALLAAADAVAGMGREGWAAGTRVVFAGFQGERYGFLGSRKFLNDLFSPSNAPNVHGFGGFSCETEVPFNNGTQAPWCIQPFKYSLAFQEVDPTKISHVITVDGVGTGAASELFLHSPTEDETFATQVKQNADDATSLNGVAVRAASTPANIPPTPLSSAVQAGIAGLNGVTITGYDGTFSNADYMGPGDVLQTLDTAKIAAAAVVVVEAVLAAVGVVGATSSAVSGAAVNSTLIEELVICFLNGPTDDGCTLYDDYAYIYPSYDQSTVYAAAPTSWIGSPSEPYGTYCLYTGVFSQPYLYRAGEGWDTSYTQVNWLHRVGPGEFERFADPYEYNDATDTITVPTQWSEYFVWNFLADRFGAEVNHTTAAGAATASCDSYVDCGAAEADMACINGKCKRHFTYFHDAVSTAVSALDYQVYEVNASALYAELPVYAEPVWGVGWWDTAQVRLFIPANPVDEWVLFGFGVVVLVVSTLFVYFKLPRVLTDARVILD